MIERRLAIALDLQQHAIPHVQQDATPAVATAADTLEDGGGRLPIVLQSRGWLVDVHASKSKGARTDGQVLSIAGSRFRCYADSEPCHGV
jgi:hypothetical protein